MLGVLAYVVYSVFLGGGYSSYSTLKENLASQQRKNGQIDRQVEDLRHKVLSLQHDERALERVAREELGMARPNEMIFSFEEQKK